MAATRPLLISSPRQPTAVGVTGPDPESLKALSRRVMGCATLDSSYIAFKGELAKERLVVRQALHSCSKVEVELFSRSINAIIAIIDGKLQTTDAGKLDLLADAILEKGDTEGLFRLCGTKVGIASLLGDFLSDAVEDIKDVHTLTGAFKQTLREQKPSLLDAIKNDLLKEGLAPAELKPLIQRLGAKEKAELKIVLDLLSEITVSAETNQMDARNLATCLAPNLHTPVEDLAEGVKELGPLNAVVKMMIENASALFE